MDLSDDELRERMIRLFRYAEVGRCVSSVTHDINNYLGAILAYADLMQLNPGLSEESARMLNQVADAVQKCSTLISALTSVARKEKPDVSMVDLVRVVDEVVELKRYDFRIAQIEINTAYDEAPSIVVDLPRMKMAIIYLLVNAFEAVFETAKPRRVRVHVKRSGEDVELGVWDSGPGVPGADRERIFDPFVTTKAESHLGLGLTLARSIARDHDGDLRYDPGRGFIMTLPRTSRLTKVR